MITKFILQINHFIFSRQISRIQSQTLVFCIEFDVNCYSDLWNLIQYGVTNNKAVVSFN